MIRTFVAVELDPALRAGLARVQEQFKDKLKTELRTTPAARLQWVRPESIHVTLKFLGDLEEARIEAVCRALERTVAGLSPFSIAVQGIGVFPHVRAPRVLWAGVSSQEGSGEPDALGCLVAAVEQALQPLEFPPETRAFHPHLTLARIKERPHEIGLALNDTALLHSTTRVGTLAIRSVALMQSELAPSGSRYTRLCDIPLGTGPADR